jgi:hypothetical protein
MAGPTKNRDVQREIDRLGEVVARLQQRDLAMRRLLLLPTPDPQRADCEIRVSQTDYTKRARMTRHFGRTRRLVRAGASLIAEARVDCSGASVDRVKRAFEWLGEMPVDQMGRRDLPAGGRLLSAFVDDAGQVTARVLITDPVSVRKALGAVYSGVLVELAGDEVDQVSLVDSPAGFTKRALGGAMICKVFARKGGAEVKKPVAVYTKKFLKLQKAVARAARATQGTAPPSTAREVITELKAASEDLAGGGGDLAAKQARYDRAMTAGTVELLKRARSRIVPPWAGG